MMEKPVELCVHMYRTYSLLEASEASEATLASMSVCVFIEVHADRQVHLNCKFTEKYTVL